MRLLLLEDDYALRRSLGRKLRADGCAVDEVRTIAQALKRLPETRYAEPALIYPATFER